MRKVFSLLIAFVFFHTQAWALSGGPVFGGLDKQSTTGTYAGVLIPDTETNATSGGSSASIGLFSVAVADSGPATGAAIVFVDGVAYNGNIVGIVDPERASLQAIVEAVSNFDIITLVPSTTAGAPPTQLTSKIFAQGSLTASIRQAGATTSFTGSQTVAALRLSGTASLDLFSELRKNGTPKVSNTVTFQVDGFKQSDTATAATFNFTPGGPTSNTSGTGTGG